MQWESVIRVAAGKQAALRPNVLTVQKLFTNKLNTLNNTTSITALNFALNPTTTMTQATKHRYRPTEAKYKGRAEEMFVTYDLSQETRGGGPAGGGGQRPPVPEEGVKVIVRDSRGKRTITEATSGKGGEYKIALAPGKYEVEAVLQKSLLCEYCRRTVEVKSGEVARVDLDLYVIQP